MGGNYSHLKRQPSNLPLLLSRSKNTNDCITVEFYARMAIFSCYSGKYGSYVQPNKPCMLCGRIVDTGLHSFCYWRITVNIFNETVSIKPNLKHQQYSNHKNTKCKDVHSYSFFHQFSSFCFHPCIFSLLLHKMVFRFLMFFTDYVTA